MRLTDEQRKQYYADLGIDRDDLLSEVDITLGELPPDVQLDERQTVMVLGIVREWNRLDALSKIDAAQSMERRVLTRRSADSAEAWGAYLLLGRLRDSEARRAVMQKIARRESSLAQTRPKRQRDRTASVPRTAQQRRDGATFLAPTHARLRDGVTGSRRETTRDQGTANETINIRDRGLSEALWDRSGGAPPRRGRS
ncbi:hypothetical protein [Nannocystis pusilla]|uniref:hypothetical protein n=1 Tax=Nannocystis pusilla TaxID=889268 RepID=UPI003BF02A5D